MRGRAKVDMLKFLTSMALTLLIVLTVTVGQVWAQALPTHYPTVISPTGQPYGPTQAHYQYFKRYGVPYQGYTGLDIANGYPAPGTPVNLGGQFGWGGGFYPGWGSSVFAQPHPSWNPYWNGVAQPSPWGGGVVVMSPLHGSVATYQGFYGGHWGVAPGVYLPPPTVLPSGTFSPVMEDSIRQERERWQKPLTGFQSTPEAMKLIEPSKPEAQLKSVRFEAQGDREVQGLKFAAALASYNQGVKVARDRVEPRVKLAYTLAMRGEYPQAAQELKLALALDPHWPTRALALDEFFGEQNFTTKVILKERMLEWVQQDIRDPERLFLMGAILHADRDSRGLALIESAARLQGMAPHLAAFLTPESVRAVSAVADEPEPHPVQELIMPPQLPALPQVLPPLNGPSPDETVPPPAEPQLD